MWARVLSLALIWDHLEGVLEDDSLNRVGIMLWRTCLDRMDLYLAH